MQRYRFLLAILALSPVMTVNATEPARIVISADKTSFSIEPQGIPFAPRGFNYDHNREGELLEDYWDRDWPAVERHFQQMKSFGANVVRIHLQLPRFMKGPDEPNTHALDRLTQLLALAEKNQMFLDLTGLGCYHKRDVPAWYGDLDESDRWKTQANFWSAVASRGETSPAVFCYDLMNEPVVPGGKRPAGDWLGPDFAGKHFVQFITLDQRDRPRPEIARLWTRQLVSAIRTVDRQHLITIGLVDWSLDRPGLTSGFVPEVIAPEIDFVSVHLYPERNHVAEALETLQQFQIGKPVLIEETFPLKCSPAEFAEFIAGAEGHAAGWIGFYWGTPPEDLMGSSSIGDALLLQQLQFFIQQSRRRK